jgi:hypothetical protein
MGNEAGSRVEASVRRGAHSNPGGGQYSRVVAQERHSIEEVYLPGVMKAGPMPRRALMALLQKEVESACL